MRCSSLPSCTNSVDFANEHLNWDHTSESAKQANSWLWRGKDSDSLDTLRLALSARIPTTEAVDMLAHLSPPSYKRSPRVVRLLSFTSSQRMLTQYAYMRNLASRPDAP